MTKDQLQRKWLEMKGEVQRHWGRLTNGDLDQVNGNLEKLVGMVQERYGYARARAQKEVDEFRKLQAQAHRQPADATR